MPDTPTDPYGWAVSDAGLYDAAQECYMGDGSTPGCCTDVRVGGVGLIGEVPREAARGAVAEGEALGQKHVDADDEVRAHQHGAPATTVDGSRAKSWPSTSI